MIAFLIMSYGNKFLSECVNSIRTYYPSTLICIVYNDITAVPLFTNDQNIRHSHNTSNSFELGAIWYATKTWTDITKFITLQNSLVLKNKLPEEMVNKDYAPLWTACVTDWSPIINIIEPLIYDTLQFPRNTTWDGICGCCCVVSTDILKKLISDGFDSFCPKNKTDAVASEIILGFLIHEHLGIKEPPLHEYSQGYNNMRKSPWVFKIGGGQGVLPNTSKFHVNLSTLPSFQNSDSKNDIFIQILVFFQKNDEESNNILDSYPLTIDSGNKKINCILGGIRHRLATKRYFPTYFNIEYQQFINREKMLW